MHVCFNRAHGALNNQLDAHGRREMKDDVALVDQLGGDRAIVDAVNRVVKVRVVFQMVNVLDAAGGKIVDDEDLVATLEVCVAEMRADEAGAAGN